MKPRPVLVFSLITVLLLGTSQQVRAQGADAPGEPVPDGPFEGEPFTGRPTVQGHVVVGNGIPNGVGTSLGRLFVRVRGLDTENDGHPVSLELPLTTSTLRVEPTSCAEASETSESACANPGRGIAAVNGYPTVFATNFMHLKLGGAVYLPYDLSSRGSSFEIAFEGTINVGTGAPENATFTILLSHSNVDQIRSWGAESTPDRPFDDNTGTGIIVSDSSVHTFSGRLTGIVLKNDGKAVLVAARAAEFRAGVTLNGQELTLEPDFEAAAAAGLPADTFLLLETNYSGLPSPSSVFPGAATNDVEVVVTARELTRNFTRGDCNGDGDAIHGLLDAMYLLQFNFVGGPEPPCLAACDADADGSVLGRVTDALFLLSYAFLAGQPPPPPFPECGPTPAGETDELNCETAVCSDS